MAMLSALTHPRTDKQKLLSLFAPILLETLGAMLFGLVDSVLLARISDNAVGAVGTATTYLGMFYLLFGVISGGVLAVMLQYYGSGQKGAAFQTRKIALFINGGIGLSLSLALSIAAPWILQAIGISEALQADATIYFHIVGVACLVDAVTPIASSYLRAFDRTRYSLISALSGNAVNLGLDALFLFAFGWGVRGVAIATVIGKLVTLALCFFFGRVMIHGTQYTDRVAWKTILRQILRIGLPGAIETTSYSVAMTLVMVFLNRMDPTGYEANARAVAGQITNFAYCAAYALGQANIIVVGWKLGEGKRKECYSITRFSLLLAIGVSLLLELFFAILGPWIGRAFTQNETLLNTVRIVLFIDLALELGRSTNLVVGNTLKSTGDAWFPMVVAVIVTSLIVIGGTYLFGVTLGLGVIGAFIALAADECVRAIIIFFRWASGKWEKQRLVSIQEEPMPALEGQEEA